MLIRKTAKLIFILLFISNAFAINKLMPFSFKNKKLQNIIDEIASISNINIIYPQRLADIEDFKKQEISYQPIDSKYITIDKAWDLITFFLDLSGFNWFKKNNNLWEIIPSGKSDQAAIAREPVQTYINTSPEDLPETENVIRYVYYLSNLKIARGENNPINVIIKDMSSEVAAKPIYLPQANGFILIDKSNSIASIINLISSLDKLGFRESIQIIPIFNVNATDIAEKLNILKKASDDDNTYFIRDDPKSNLLTYFGTDTQIVTDLRQNTLILMGSEFNINKIKEFIQNYMDVPIQSGKTILHSYDLQYLNAQEFAPILQKIVTNQIQFSQGIQASTGPQKYFQGVIVKSENLVQVKPATGDTSTPGSNLQKQSNFEPKGIQGQIYIGGNRLVIAALEDDWLYIKDFITRMDVPQPQVILEVVMVDFDVNKLNKLAGDSRSLTQTPQSGQQFLSSNITPVVNVLGQNPMQLAQDLLGVIGAQSLTSNISPSSTLISFNDPLTPGIWGLIQILDRFTVSKIHSTPFVVSTNNQKATLSQVLKQRARGDMIPTDNGSYQIPIEEVTATINLDLVPHIASDQKVKLDFAIRIENFVPNTLTRLTRGINTTATMANNQILAVGGLIREEQNNNWTGTPIFKNIPIVGTFFRGEQYETIRNNIVIFISPTIVMPKAQAAAEITKERLVDSLKDLNFSQKYINERDPITKFFFKDNQRANGIINDYLSLSSNIIEIDLIKDNYDSYFIPRPKNRKTVKLKNKSLTNLLKSELNFFR